MHEQKEINIHQNPDLAAEAILDGQIEEWNSDKIILKNQSALPEKVADNLTEIVKIYIQGNLPLFGLLVLSTALDFIKGEPTITNVEASETALIFVLMSLASATAIYAESQLNNIKETRQQINLHNLQNKLDESNSKQSELAKAMEKNTLIEAASITLKTMRNSTTTMLVLLGIVYFISVQSGTLEQPISLELLRNTLSLVAIALLSQSILFTFDSIRNKKIIQHFVGQKPKQDESEEGARLEKAKNRLSLDSDQAEEETNDLGEYFEDEDDDDDYFDAKRHFVVG